MFEDTNQISHLYMKAKTDRKSIAQHGPMRVAVTKQVNIKCLLSRHELILIKHLKVTNLFVEGKNTAL